jgi:hypothetical protein
MMWLRLREILKKKPAVGYWLDREGKITYAEWNPKVRSGLLHSSFETLLEHRKFS